MPYSVEAKNLMLNALGAVAVRVSVHDANPGSTGASEAAGSTRGTIAYAAADIGAMNKTAPNPTVTNIPSTFTVRFVGLWTSAGVYLGYDPVPDTTTAGGVPWTYAVTSSTLDLNLGASA